MSKRRARSVRPARRVIRTRRPSQTASNSARVISAGRGASGALNQDLVLAGLAEQQEAAVAQDGNPGKGVLASRAQSRPERRALRPSSLAHRSISGTPIASVPSRWRICSGSAADALEAQKHHEGGKTLMA